MDVKTNICPLIGIGKPEPQRCRKGACSWYLPGIKVCAVKAVAVVAAEAVAESKGEEGEENE